jgi:hypothetical protein
MGYPVSVASPPLSWKGLRTVPNFAELGIPFPLFEADVRNASDYKGLATCVLCGQTRVHCFGVNEVIVPCSHCDCDMAFDTRQDEQMTCPRCGVTHMLPALPRDQYRKILVCYACLRAGRAAFDHDTIVGMVAWEHVQAGHTLELPVEPEPEPDRQARPPTLLADGTSVMLPIGPEGPLYAGPAARQGFEHVVVARRPFGPGGPELDWEAVRVPQVHLVELLRTPSYSTWQGERWLICCLQPMVYVGEWTAHDFEQYAGAGKGRALFDAIVPDTFDGLWGNGSAGIYVFRCTACGRLDCHWDLD